MALSNESIVNNITEFRDSRPLIDQDPWHAYPYLIAVMVSIVFGTFGNIMTVVVCIFFKMLRKSGSAAIINLAIADFVVSGIADPMCILGVLKGKEFFDRHPVLCELTAMFCLSACICSFLSLGFYTSLTYTYVCHNTLYYKVFDKKMAIIAGCIGAWCLAVLFEMPNMLGWGDHIFDEKNHQCIFNRVASPSYSYFLTVGLVLGPLGMMLAAYGHIFYTIFKTKKALLEINGNSGLSLFRKQWQETLRTSRTMIIIVLFFVICWTPYCLVLMIDMADRLPFWVHLWVTYLAHFHSVVNFYIYLATNKHYRNAFKQILKKVTLQEYRESKSTTTTVSRLDQSSEAVKSQGNSTVYAVSTEDVQIERKENEKA